MISMYERVENLIKDNRNTTFKIIAKQLLLDFQQGIFKSQNELAETCFVSLATITQFSKATLCEGYKELTIRLKIEYENTLGGNRHDTPKKIDYENLDLTNFEAIKTWVYESSDFILKFSKIINKRRKLWIAPSFQSMQSAVYLQTILRNQGIEVYIMDSSINLEIVRHIDFKNEVVLILFTGRDTDTLSRMLDFLKILTAHVFIITTQNHITEIPDDSRWEKLMVNYPISTNDYRYRSIAMMILFFLISEKVFLNAKIK